MKRLVLICSLSMALFGCDDNKVTNKYLTGNWDCTFFEYKASWKDGLYQSFGNFPEKEGKVFVKFYMKDYTLWVESETIDAEFDLSVLYRKRPAQKPSSDITIESDFSIEYLSKDKFKMTTILEYRYDSHEKDNFKTKTELYCKRLKNEFNQ